MPSVEVTTTVAASSERVFEAATDLARLPETMSGIDSVEVLSDGPFGEGTRWRETRTLYGKQATEEMWVTGFDPPRSYVVEAESHGAHYRTEITFVPEGDRTRVTFVFGARPLSFFARLFSVFSGLMLKSVRKALEQDLDDLKRVVESAG
ncbi:MAG: SRPBCC family protein [Acidobacteriota bacterium]|nr:SRPBCC family protein [Acidobacteriota bacterium]MDE2712686.1 SRPBCC family protein [Acidobacteriota bacterium]MXW70459.1 SRPBCC family protein [Acidobacteriota bacterium]MXX86493.1 SRPBCC family protein [Acidobacteriota bacterium]MYE44666.1 SRPBCC family protein [Acidobacteriota bacterium]